jgi:hypothetical protein
MARQRQAVGGFTPQGLSESYMPNSESITSAYSKIMGDRGYDPQQELEDVAKKNFDDFMQRARRGEVQGRGAYSKKFAPTAMGFTDYLAADAAYNLHQGRGGKAEADKMKYGNLGQFSINY